MVRLQLSPDLLRAIHFLLDQIIENIFLINSPDYDDVGTRHAAFNAAFVKINHQFRFLLQINAIKWT